MNRLLATSSKLAACFIVLLMAFLAFPITEKKDCDGEILVFFCKR